MDRGTVNIVGQISHFFSVNRPLSILILISILLFGLFAFWLTPKQYNPEIVRPAFAISLEYQGATIEDAERRVLYELVEKIRTVPGVDDVYSEIRDGATVNTTVIFEVGYDAEKAKLDLLSQLEQHSYLARGFISKPTIVEINPETIPVLQVVFGGEELTIYELREQVTALTHELVEVGGVSEVAIYGGYEPALVVEVDVEKLGQAGVSLSDLKAVIKGSQSRTVSRGVNSGDYKIELAFDGQVESPAEIGALLLTEGILVRDVAKVYEGSVGDRSYLLHHSEGQTGEVVALSVAKVEGSSAPVVTKAFLNELDESLLQADYRNLSYEVVGDDGVTASNEIYGLTKNLLTSILIVAVVLVLFLSTRAAAVVLVAIPTTLLIVFGLGFLFDETINRITLFALILSLGLLVDSAIVVTENIYAHLKSWKVRGKQESKASVVARSVHEIGAGLILSTVTSVIVFLPMGYITGMMGPYMGPISFFVPAALTVSLLVAVVITPFVASHFLDGSDKVNRLTHFFDSVMQKVVQLYTNFLRTVLYSRQLQKNLLRGALGVFVISLILPALALVHFQMLPKADLDQFYVYLDLPVDTNVETTKEFSVQVSNLLLAHEEVVDTQQYIGQAPIVDFNGMFKGAQYRNEATDATVRVNLTKASKRSLSSTEIVDELREMISLELGGASAYVRLMEEPPGPPVRATMVAKVSSPQDKVQKQAATALADLFAGVDGVVDIYNSTEAPVGQVVYRFDYEAANELGVTLAEVEEVFWLLSEPVEVTEYVRSDSVEFAPVLITAQDDQRNSPSDISNLKVINKNGETVSVGSVVKVEHQARESKLEFDRAKSITYVTAEVAGRSVVYSTIDVISALIKGKLTGYEVTNWNLFTIELKHLESGSLVELNWGGEWEMTLENFRDLGIAMGVALLLVYGILVAHYNRFATPAYILVTVPLGLVGILWGFLVLDNIFGIYLTATALIGFIALIGIVVNNAIIFLEYVTQKLNQGETFPEALLLAGEARVRPILLTSLTTVLGSLTIANDPVWSGLAWAIVFGLSLSTVLTLIVYPTLLIYFKVGE